MKIRAQAEIFNSFDLTNKQIDELLNCKKCHSGYEDEWSSQKNKNKTLEKYFLSFLIG